MRDLRFCLRAGLLAIAGLAHATSTRAADAVTAPAVPPAIVAPPALQLAPNSVGAALLAWAEAELQRLSNNLGQLLQAATDFPLLWIWLQRLATDVDLQALILAATWRLLLVMAVGIGAEYLVRRALRDPMQALRRNVPQGTGCRASTRPNRARANPAGGARR